MLSLIIARFPDLLNSSVKLELEQSNTNVCTELQIANELNVMTYQDRITYLTQIFYLSYYTNDLLWCW